MLSNVYVETFSTGFGSVSTKIHQKYFCITFVRAKYFSRFVYSFNYNLFQFSNCATKFIATKFVYNIFSCNMLPGFVLFFKMLRKLLKKESSDTTAGEYVTWDVA